MLLNFRNSLVKILFNHIANSSKSLLTELFISISVSYLPNVLNTILRASISLLLSFLSIKCIDNNAIPFLSKNVNL